MALTDTAVRHAKARSKPYKLFDSRGLFLHVMPHGGKWWRFKYRYFGKEKLLSLGVFPDVSLKEARNRRETERKKLADKIDPAVNRKLVKLAWTDNQANSFEVVAREWIGKKSPIWSDSNTAKTTRRLEVDVFP
jgi:hypothetical protein